MIQPGINKGSEITVIPKIISKVYPKARMRSLSRHRELSTEMLATFSLHGKANLPFSW